MPIAVGEAWLMRLPARHLDSPAVLRELERRPGATVMVRETPARADPAPLARSVARLRQAGASRVVQEWPASTPLRAAWLGGVAPDRVDLHTPALSGPTAGTLGLPGAGSLAATLVESLRAGVESKVAVRIVLHVGRAALADLEQSLLDALGREAGLAESAGLEVVLVPRVGDQEEALRLDELALRVLRLGRSKHRLLRSLAWPACAMPRGLEVDHAHDPQSVARGFAPGCDGCVMRAPAGICQGLIASQLAALEDEIGCFEGPRSLDPGRLPGRSAGPAIDPIEVGLRALALGLRRVARFDDLDDEQAEALMAQVEAGRNEGTGRFAGHGLYALATRSMDLATDGTLLRSGAQRGGRRVRLVLASRDPEALGRVRDIEEMGDWPTDDYSRELGQHYGYPACCVEAFLEDARLWRRAPIAGVSENAWVQLRAARRGSRVDPRLDLISGTQAATFTRHFPCRLDCAATLATFAALLDDLARDRPALPRELAGSWPAAVLLFADAVNLALDGERVGDTLVRPRLRPLDPAAVSNATSIARSRRAALAPRVHRALALRTAAVHEPAAVHLVDEGGQEAPLFVAGGSASPDFPRLLFFATR